jgi:proteasome lid subunit RPN8/RPN11
MEASDDRENLEISEQQYEMIIAHLTEEYPLEGCGLLAGREGLVTAVYPITNILQSKTIYEMDPLQQIKTMLAIEENGDDLLAIYHSHPHGPTTPSTTDIANAYYPETIYLIISLQQKDEPQINGYRIVENIVSEIKVRIC